MPIEPKNLDGLPGAVRFHLASDLVGDTFEISVAVPDLAGLAGLGMPNLPDAFRVLYVTDADLTFPVAYGGLLTSYALFGRFPLFDRYIIGSPGNVFPDDFVLDLEQRCWDAGRTLNASAYLTCGSLERTSWSEGLRYIAIAYDKLCARLAGREYEGFTLDTREYEGESHVSVGLPTLIDGIGLLYPGDPKLAPRSLLARGSPSRSPAEGSPEP